MTHPALPDLIDGIYAAAAGEQAWSDVADRLRRAVAADTAVLIWCEPDGVEVLGTPGFARDALARQAAYFNAVDPWAQSGFSIVDTARRTGQLRGAVLGPEIVPEAALRSSEWYNDFGRGVGNYHLLGAMQPVTASGTLLVGAHRPERSRGFEDDQRAVLDALLPHLRRGLGLWSRLQGRGELAAAALDALADGAVVLDADLRLLHVNAAAEALLRNGALRLAKDGRTTRLATAHRGDEVALGRLVRKVAVQGAAGGSLALRGAEGQPLAAVVMRLPARLAPVAAGRALLLLRDPARLVLPPPSLLCDLYGLSGVEAEVALAAGAGKTAEDIAVQRRVSVNTVRAQIRAVLEKCGAANLRDLTLLLGALRF